MRRLPATRSHGCARRSAALAAADGNDRSALVRPPQVRERRPSGGASLTTMIPITPDARSARSAGRRRLAGIALTVATLLASCGVISTTPPAPTPADFLGITANLDRRDIAVDHVTSGDAGCDDPTLRQTAIAFDARGLDQATPVRVYIYIFRNREAFDRLRQSVDACAASYAGDPNAFASVEASPYVVASAGPWGPRFQAAMRAAISAAAGTGG